MGNGGWARLPGEVQGSLPYMLHKYPLLAAVSMQGLRHI